MFILFNNYISNISRLLIIIYPFLLVSGSFLPDLACVFVGFSFFLYSIQKKSFNEYNNYIIFFLLFIYIYLNINSFFSFNPKISFETSLAYIRIILFIAGLSFFFKKYKKLKYYLFYSFILCLFIIFIDSLYQWFVGHDLLGFKVIQNRISSFFGRKLILGSFLSRLLPFLIALTLLTKFKKKELITLLILLVTGILVVLSNERLSFVYYFLFIIYYFFLNFNKKTFLKYTIILISVFGVIYSYKHTVFDRVFLHTYKQYKQTNNIFALSYRHQTHFQTAYNMFLDNKLLGQGLKSFRYLCDDPKFSVREKIIRDYTILSPADGTFGLTNELDKNIPDQINDYIIIKNNNIVIYKKLYKKFDNFYFYHNTGDYVKIGEPLFSSPEYLDGCNTHPHNIYLQFLAELGLVGFILFLIMFIYIFYQLIFLSIKKFRKKMTNIEMAKSFILFGIFFSMIPFFPSGNYFNNWLLLITYFPIGFYLSLVKFSND